MNSGKRWKNKVLFKIIASSFILRLMNIVFIALGTLILAKILPPIEFGTYSLIISYVAIIIIPLQSGIPILNIRIISSKKHPLIPLDLIKFTSITIIVYFFIISCIELMLDNILISPIADFRYLFYFLSLSTISISILSSYIQGLNHILQSQYIEQLIRPLLFILPIIIIIYTKIAKLSYENVLYLLSFSYIASSFIAFIYIYSHKRFCYEKIKKETKLIWIKSLIPLCSLTGLQVLLSQMDIIVLANIKNLESVAVYKIATQFAVIVTLISTVIGVIIAPIINQLYNTDVEKLKLIVHYSNWLSLLSGVILFTLFYFFSEYIITRLLTESYKDASTYLLILCLGYIISTLFGPISTIVNMLSLEKFNLASIAIAVITNLLLLILLVPFLGSLGAAISTAISTIIWKLTLTCFVKNKIRIPCYLKIKS